MKILKGKASTAELDNLHNVVADVISTELQRQAGYMQSDDEHDRVEFLPDGIDTKLLGQAIAFLKNNNITADVLESNAMKSLTENIKEIANKKNELEDISVEDMLAIAERK